MERFGENAAVGKTAEGKHNLLVNLAAVAAVLLLALGAFLLSKALPARDITPNAGTVEEAGIVFTMDDPAD